MFKDEKRIIILAIIAGLTLWVADAVFDFISSPTGDFLDHLILDISFMCLIFRVVNLAICLMFGIILSKMYLKNRTANVSLETLIQAIPDMVFFKDADGRHIVVNKSFEEFLGIKQSEILGKTNEELLPQELARQCSDSDEELKKGNKIKHVEEMVGRDGEKILDTIKIPLYDKNGVYSGMVGICRDITNRKRTDEELKRYREHLEDTVRERTADMAMATELLRLELEERKQMEEEILKHQRLESLGILAGGIAHDFNNIVTAILSNISLARLYLKDKNLEKIPKRFEAAEKACIRVQGLTQQLLTFSKGRDPVKKTTCIGELIIESTNFALRGSNVACEFSIREDLWATDVDETQIGQVINNLVINAEQAMPEGGIMEVDAENITIDKTDGLPLQDGNYVRIAVKDHGIGIPVEYISKIFDPYFTTKQRGSGLGLATTYSIIRKHDGHISVESELGTGTGFYIYLPASQNSAVKDKGDMKEICFISKGNILVMDDEEDVRASLRELLSFLGYKADFAENGSRAVELYLQARESGKPYDLVLMDLTIPGGMGGKETIQKLLKINPDVKAIVSSGYSNDPVMAEYKEYGFCDVIAKPYDAIGLSTVLHNVMNVLILP